MCVLYNVCKTQRSFSKPSKEHKTKSNMIICVRIWRDCFELELNSRCTSWTKWTKIKTKSSAPYSVSRRRANDQHRQQVAKFPFNSFLLHCMLTFTSPEQITAPNSFVFSICQFNLSLNLSYILFKKYKTQFGPL